MANGDKKLIFNSKAPYSEMWKKIKGVNEVHIGESRSDIKEVKTIAKGFSYQIASLTAAKSIEPHAYNKFYYDSCQNKGITINVMRK